MTNQQKAAELLKDGPLTPAEFCRVWLIKYKTPPDKNVLTTGKLIKLGESKVCSLTGDYRKAWVLA